MHTDEQVRDWFRALAESVRIAGPELVRQQIEQAVRVLLADPLALEGHRATLRMHAAIERGLNDAGSLSIDALLAKVSPACRSDAT